MLLVWPHKEMFPVSTPHPPPRKNLARENPLAKNNPFHFTSQKLPVPTAAQCSPSFNVWFHLCGLILEAKRHSSHDYINNQWKCKSTSRILQKYFQTSHIWGIRGSRLINKNNNRLNLSKMKKAILSCQICGFVLGGYKIIQTCYLCPCLTLIFILFNRLPQRLGFPACLFLLNLFSFPNSLPPYPSFVSVPFSSSCFTFSFQPFPSLCSWRSVWLVFTATLHGSL